MVVTPFSIPGLLTPTETTHASEMFPSAQAHVLAYEDRTTHKKIFMFGQEIRLPFTTEVNPDIQLLYVHLSTALATETQVCVPPDRIMCLGGAVIDGTLHAAYSARYAPRYAEPVALQQEDSEAPVRACTDGKPAPDIKGMSALGVSIEMLQFGLRGDASNNDRKLAGFITAMAWQLERTK